MKRRIKKIYEKTKPVGQRLQDIHLTAFASESAFFILMSVIPFLMFFSSLLKFTPISEAYVLTALCNLFPENISNFLEEIFDEVYRSSSGVLPISVVAAVWTSAKSIHYMMDGFNAIHGIQETRGWLQLRIRSTIYMIIFVTTLLIIFLSIIFGNKLEALALMKLPLLSFFLRLKLHIRYIIIFAFLTLFFALLFYVLPNKKLLFLRQLPGAILCSIGWFTFTYGLNMYVKYFNGFSVYGSLATLMLCMLWLYMCMTIMFFCVYANIWLEARWHIANEFIEKMRQKREDRRSAAETGDNK